MKRKLDLNRIYKLVRSLIIITSVIILLFAIYLKITFPDFEKFTTETFKDCVNNLGLGIGCNVYLDMAVNQNKKIINLFIIGLGLPAIFFGGKGLINYIAPVVKKNEKS